MLLTTSMVEGMAEGAVVVDMAADQGGNCELTKAGEVVTTTASTSSVWPTRPRACRRTPASSTPATWPTCLGLMGPRARCPDWDDEIVSGMCVLRDGAAVAPAAVELLGGTGGTGAPHGSAVVIHLLLETTPTGRRRGSWGT